MAFYKHVVAFKQDAACFKIANKIDSQFSINVIGRNIACQMILFLLLIINLINAEAPVELVSVGVKMLLFPLC